MIKRLKSKTARRNGAVVSARAVKEDRHFVEALFTHRWKLEQADEAYKLFDRQTTGKGVFLM